MVDPITLVITAVALGAAAGVKDTAAAAVNDAYTGLKHLLARREVDVSAVERRPDSPTQQAALREILTDTGGVDGELVAAAHAVTDAVAAHDPQAARVVGVDLRDVQAEFVRIGAVTSAGDGVTAEGVRLSGGFTVDEVRAGVDAGVNPGGDGPRPFAAVGQPAPTAGLSRTGTTTPPPVSSPPVSVPTPSAPPSSSGLVAVAVSGGSLVGGDVNATVYVDARARRAAAAVLVVRPDPAADAGFVGRAAELGQLLHLLAPDTAAVPPGNRTASSGAAGPAESGVEVGVGGAGGASVVVVSAVAGAPGVGKTALAQAAARAAVTAGWFPGGAVTVNLHGYDPDPTQVVWPAQLYPGLLRTLGVPGENIPPTELEQATVYHQVLDQYTAVGRAVLVVLDNVGDPDQVATVLPRGDSPHRVLITSRDSMARLGRARLFDLPVLRPDGAVHLLAAGLRGRDSADGRVAADPGAATRLVALCGWLPLAVQIVAALLADEPNRLLTAMVADLSDEQQRLHRLDYDRGWAVRAAFDLSHRRLTPPTAALFALLGAVPGPDVGLAVAAAVADRDEPCTRAGLRALCRAHLLDQQPAQQEGEGPRWRMHDLIRLYAAEHLTPDQHTAGFARILAHYRHTADLAQRRFTALPADLDQVPAGFATPQQAVAWVSAERAGLVACTGHAAGTHPDDTVQLAADLAPILARARLLADWVTIASTAVNATNTLDRHTAAAAWNNLGLALGAVRRFDEAITAHQQSGDIYREVGDRHSEGGAWNNLGLALVEVRRFDEAITAHQQSGDIFREVGDRHSEGGAWNNLGLALVEVRRFDEAITAHQQDLEICREVGDRHGEGTAWNNLGLALGAVRRFDEAITAHQQSGDIFREVGDRHSEGGAWNNLGNALVEVRRFDEAITAHQQAGDIYREVNDQYGQAQTLEDVGFVHVELAQSEQARRAWVDGAELYAAVGAEDDADRVRRAIAGLGP